MDLLITFLIVVGIAVLVEVRAKKHDKPVQDNLQAVRQMRSNAKPLRRPGEHNV